VVEVRSLRVFLHTLHHCQQDLLQQLRLLVLLHHVHCFRQQFFISLDILVSDSLFDYLFKYVEVFSKGLVLVLSAQALEENADGILGVEVRQQLSHILLNQLRALIHMAVHSGLNLEQYIAFLHHFQTSFLFCLFLLIQNKLFYNLALYFLFPLFYFLINFPHFQNFPLFFIIF